MVSLRPRWSCSLPCHLRLLSRSLFFCRPKAPPAGWLAASLMRVARSFQERRSRSLTRRPTSAVTPRRNENGDYDFVEVPVGTYRLEFDLTGFKKNVRRGVSLDINQVITLNMTMQVGATQEVVDVTSEAPLVETTSTQLGAVVGDRAVSELPLNSRDTYQFFNCSPE